MPVPPVTLAVNVKLPFKQTEVGPEMFTVGSGTIVNVFGGVVADVPQASVTTAV